MKSNKGNLIDRYVMEVGRRLNDKQRADVQLELRSSLQDALEERGLDAERKEDEAKIVELLREFGRPSQVSAGYGARMHLIGPELQPFYWMVLRLNALVISIVHLTGLVIAVVNQTNFGTALVSAMGNLVNSFLVSFAIVTIIFAVLERILPELKLPVEEWDPRKLPEITPDRDKVDVLELIFEIVFTTAFVSVLNVMPGWQFPADAAVIKEVLLKFQPYFAWITTLAVVNIVLDIYLLTRGRWQPVTRWIAFGHAAATVVLVASTLSLAPYSPVELIDSIVYISVAIALIFSLIDAAVKFYRVARPGAPLPWGSKRFEMEMKDLAEQSERFGKAVEERIKKG